MSIIGSSPGIMSGPIVETGAMRAIGAQDSRTVRQTSSDIAVANAPVVTSTALGTALDAGTAPVDQARVATIRKAIATDSYPVVPAKIGDAMIAAGMLLRMRK